MVKKEDEIMLRKLIKNYKSSNGSKDSLELMVAGVTYVSKLKPNIKDNILSLMETLCLILLAIGKNPYQCGNFLDISVKTVRTYEQRARKKLGAKNRVNAFYLAQMHGYVSFAP